jgi:hypothetical protein
MTEAALERNGWLETTGPIGIFAGTTSSASTGLEQARPRARDLIQRCGRIFASVRVLAGVDRACRSCGGVPDYIGARTAMRNIDLLR